MPQYFVRIAQLKLKGGISNRKIADILGIWHNIANGKIHKIGESGFSFKEIAHSLKKRLKPISKEQRIIRDQIQSMRYQILRYRQNPMSQKQSSGKYRDGCLLSSKKPYTVYQQSLERLLFDNAYGTKGSHFRFLTEKT